MNQTTVHRPSENNNNNPGPTDKHGQHVGLVETTQPHGIIVLANSFNGLQYMNGNDVEEDKVEEIVAKTDKIVGIGATTRLQDTQDAQDTQTTISVKKKMVVGASTREVVIDERGKEALPSVMMDQPSEIHRRLQLSTKIFADMLVLTGMRPNK